MDIMKETTGCRFTLYPMTDRYIEIILGSLEKTDTRAVYSHTDALSTVYRGRLEYVADAVKALFVNAYREGVHMALEGEFAKNDPCDTLDNSVLNFEGELPNASIISDIHFPVHGKWELYAMGISNYVDYVNSANAAAAAAGILTSPDYYCGKVDGDVHEVMNFYEDVCKKLTKIDEINHFTLHFTVNCNSPTA